MADLVRQDRINILVVDLARTWPGSRLMVFARKPAPVRVTLDGARHLPACQPWIIAYDRSLVRSPAFEGP